MIPPAEVESLREEQEKWLGDVGAVTRPSAEAPVYHDESGLYVPSDPAEVYAGALRVMPDGGSRDIVIGEDVVTLRSYVGTAPATAEPEVGDIVTLSESRDAALVGRPLIITAVTYSSLETARRFSLEDHVTRRTRADS